MSRTVTPSVPCRASRAVAAAEHVDADDAPMAAVEERAVADDAGPPFGDAARTGERMRGKDDVAAVGRRLGAVDRDALLDRGERYPAVQFQRTDIDGYVTHRQLTARACSRSAMMSRLSSMPTESRIVDSSTPLCKPLFRRELLMRGAGRMNHQRLRVADVGEQREELEAIDHRFCARRIAADAERENRAAAVGQILRAERGIGNRFAPAGALRGTRPRRARCRCGARRAGPAFRALGAAATR